MIERTNEGFQGEFRFLSNFYPAQIVYTVAGTENFTYPTSEHLYQVFKTLTLPRNEQKFWVEKILSNPSPFHAKKVAKKLPIETEAWNEIAYHCMSVTVFQKFHQNEHLKNLLLNTGSIELVEFNSWNDITWGVNIETGEGKNQLGKILTETRTYFQQPLYV